jgi:hypothetical protein
MFGWEGAWLVLQGRVQKERRLQKRRRKLKCRPNRAGLHVKTQSGGFCYRDACMFFHKFGEIIPSMARIARLRMNACALDNVAYLARQQGPETCVHCHGDC